MDAVFGEQNSNLKLNFLLNVVVKISSGLPRKAGSGKLEINVQFKHQSGTQYIEETKREDCLLYVLK